MTESEPSTDATTRVEDYARESNLEWVTAALAAHREEILSRWLDAAAAQPCHQSRRDHAVTDNIPRLFDALVQYLEHAAARAIDPGAPLEDAAIQAAAQDHALARVEQGLQPADVLVEFRLLRQELWRALRIAVPDGAPTSDVVSAELLLNDALDGAAALALSALTARLDQVREEFLATTVHDVGHPVTTIRGFAQLAERLLERPEPDLARVQVALCHIREATDHISELLTTLVDASQMALGGLVLQPGPTDLAALIPEVIAQLEPDVAQRVCLQIPPDLGMTGSWDAARLAQVLSNLLSNAAKYSPPDTPIAVRLQGDAETVRLSVHDEGIGIPSEDLPRLFGRYVRARNAIEHHSGGLGLGLYLSRSIVEAHGGRIWVTSPGPGKGTTVFVELPRHRSEREPDH
jgi:signal transduction histidine kinase